MLTAHARFALASATFALCGACTLLSAAEPVTFTQDVAPIFQAKCDESATTPAPPRPCRSKPTRRRPPSCTGDLLKIHPASLCPVLCRLPRIEALLRFASAVADKARKPLITMSAIRKLAAEAADHGLLGAGARRRNRPREERQRTVDI